MDRFCNVKLVSSCEPIPAYPQYNIDPGVKDITVQSKKKHFIGKQLHYFFISLEKTTFVFNPVLFTLKDGRFIEISSELNTLAH